MIDHCGGAMLAFAAFDPHDERRREALFTLGNGVLTWRASAPEAAFGGAPGMRYAALYRAGWYDAAPRSVNGVTQTLEALVNLPDPFGLSVSLDGEQWFSGEAQAYQQHLDLNAAQLNRTLSFRLGERHIRLHEERLVSMAEPTLALLRWTLSSDQPLPPLHVRSQLDGGVSNSLVSGSHPYEGSRLRPGTFSHRADGHAQVRVRLISAIGEVLVACQLRSDEPLNWRSELQAQRLIQHTVIEQPGTHVTLEKRVRVLVDDEIPAGTAELPTAPFASLRSAHQRAWETLWRAADVQLDDTVLDTPLRLGAWHVLQAASPLSAERDQSFPSRGWHEDYFGQIFWDELFAYSFLSSRLPAITLSMLRYRYRRLDAARENARQAGLEGALFPWRSARSGREQTPPFNYNPLSGRWMADHTYLQRHIGAAVVYGVWQHYQISGEKEFLADWGGEMVLEIARCWASLVSYDETLERFVINGVIGPDEYHTGYPHTGQPGLNNNAYTNLMAAWVLHRAVDLLHCLPADLEATLRSRLQLKDSEVAHWRHIGSRMYLPFLPDGVLNQFDGYERLQPAPREWMTTEHPRLDWMLEARNDCCECYQVSKQADVLALFHLFPPAELSELCERLGYQFDVAAMRRTADFHLARLSHESSLSKLVCAGALAHLNPQASWDSWCDCLRTDLDAPADSGTLEGVHLGAMAGSLDVLQRHYLGLHPTAECLRIFPAVPPALDGVHMGFTFQGRYLRVQLRDKVLSLHLAENAEPLDVCHPGGSETLTPGAVLRLDCHAPAAH